ncbi:hypothetical protein ACXVUM_08960 [Williamsia sp. SKLECPSW1]
MTEAEFDRVWVVGGPGAGKSTFARSYAKQLGVEPIELDALFWGPGWQARSEEWLVEQLTAKLSSPRWVVDGFYPALFTRFAARSECIVWLDPPFATSWSRLLRRTFRRVRTREELWNGNTESLRSALGPDSILLYAVRIRRDRARAIATLLPDLRDRGVVVRHLRTSPPTVRPAP